MPVGKRSEVTPEDTYPAFDTNEAFKSVAKRLGTSPNTLRKWWFEKFGQEAFEARGKRLHSAAGTRTGLASAGKARTFQETSEPCSKCGQSVTLTVLQKSRLNRVLCVPCEESERGVDRHCPVCGFGCVGEKGLSGHMARPQHGDPEAHAGYLKGQADAIWQGKVEGQDFVVCLICGHRGVRIDRHLLAEHGLSVDAYRLQHPDASVQAAALVDKRIDGLRQYHQENPRAGLLRLVRCPSCGEEHEVGLTSASSNLKCPECREEERWAGKSEGQDYVTCQVCGHRAESLVSHIRSVHPELEGHYREAFPSCRVLSVTASKKSESHKEALSESANPWKRGLSKKTDPKVASSAVKTSQTMREIRANKFWRSTDLIELTVEQLEPFRLKNGKISVGKAMAALGHAFVTIQRECERHGLVVSRRHIKEAACLDALSQVLGGSPYETEHSPEWAINPETDWGFRYDGFFPRQGLLIEFHGFQHWTFPSFYIDNEAQFRALQTRDQLKKALAKEAGVPLLVIREDEPYTDPDYLRGRLIDEGFLDP